MGLKDQGRSIDIALSLEDLLAAAERVRPSALREMAIEVPRVLWTDIGGMEQVSIRRWGVLNVQSYAGETTTEGSSGVATNAPASL
jgi:AAA family ATPase